MNTTRTVYPRTASFIAALLCCALTVTSNASYKVLSVCEETVNGVTWQCYVDERTGKAEEPVPVSGLTGGVVAIPSVLGGYPVTYIGQASSCGDGGEYRLWEIDGVTGLLIPGGGGTSIGGCDNWFDECVFARCPTLTSVMIGDGVTSIGRGAFLSCTNLASVSISDGVTSIGEEAFDGCDARLYDTNTIPGVKLVDGWAVDWEASSGHLDLTECRGIARSLFARHSGLESVTIGGGVRNIPEYAFEECRDLTGVMIGDGVTSIGDKAFAECHGLTSVTIGDGVTHIGKAAFAGCESLTNITVSAGNPAYKSVDGFLLSKDGATLVRAMNASGAVTIPDSVTSIGEGAFDGCSGLTGVTIPDSVMRIGAGAFHGCDERLYDTNTIPGVKLVDGWVCHWFGEDLRGHLDLKGCRGIVDYPSVSEFYRIDEHDENDSADRYGALDDVTSVTIPDSVTRIGAGAFGLRASTM